MKKNELIAVFSPDGFSIRESPTGEKNCYYDATVLKHFNRDKEEALYALGFYSISENKSPSFSFIYDLSQSFVRSIASDGDIALSSKVKPLSEEEALRLLRTVPFALGSEHITIPWLCRCWEALAQVFERDLKSSGLPVADYLRSKNNVLTIAGRIFFHLVEYRDQEHPFAFLATYSTGICGKVNHLPLKNALIEYGDDQERLLFLLKTVGTVCDKSRFISQLSESGELFSPLRLTTEEAYTFLTETPLYEESGVVCRIPDWWKRRGGIKVAATVGDKPPSRLGMEALLSFNPSLSIDGTRITREEAEALLAKASGLSLLKGKWVEVDQEKLREALKAFDQIASMDAICFAEAMRLQLGLSTNLPDDQGALIEISNGTWLKGLTNRMKTSETGSHLDVGNEFHATLRQYQQAGLDWLGFMGSLGFGALLADDMGLGKTIQILALLESVRKEGGGKTLLIIPASLIFNWKNEAIRFAPQLKLKVIHGETRSFDLEDGDVFLTTYGMISRVPTIHEVDWDFIILDEAQAIKNAESKQSKAVKVLHGKMKIAMTGTPIENRLSDLWSLFDFLNCGLLGTNKEFLKFTKSLQTNGLGYSRLREIVSPFILRRLKTDKSIIADLPDKIELKAMTGLSKKQLALYKALVRELQYALETADGIARKGLVLASIIKFKQICNHPDQYLGQKDFAPGESGKFEKLREICETIAEKQERVLVFTQFREMTAPLSAFLAELFNQKGLVLHGGTPVKKRGEFVDRFNGDTYVPYMVLSLKAGGVGLNLTAANHIIHFDRWWNPAVENQATDRAFRIGQQKNVMVHKFVTAGTLEEKIDQLLEEKQKLSQDIIQSGGEQWVTELSNADLMQLFRLEV